MATELSGVVRVWGLTPPLREYATVETTFGEARLIFKSDPYMALTGKGEQRGIMPTHARKIRKEIEKGNFTPTPVHVGVRPRHSRCLTYKTTGKVRTVTLVLEQGDNLPLINGGHRFESLRMIRKDAEMALDGAKSEKKKVEAQAEIDLIDSQPITAMLLLNGNTQDDFVNLQKGKAVDAAHMLSLKIARKMTSEKDQNALELAFEIAKALNTANQGSFYRQIRFDSKGMAPLPLSSLCSKGASDLGTSLTGLAKVGLAFEKPKSAEWLAFCVITVVKTLEERAPELLVDDMVLTPPPNGNKGSATMLVGAGLALAYRMAILKEDISSERTKGALTHAAREVLDRPVDGNFSGPAKRKLLGEFVEEFFGDLTDISKYQELPEGLLRILAPSAFGASPFPKVKKGKSASLPDVDGPLPLPAGEEPAAPENAEEVAA